MKKYDIALLFFACMGVLLATMPVGAFGDGQRVDFSGFSVPSRSVPLASCGEQGGVQLLHGSASLWVCPAKGFLKAGQELALHLVGSDKARMCALGGIEITVEHDVRDGVRHLYGCADDLPTRKELGGTAWHVVIRHDGERTVLDDGRGRKVLLYQ